MTGQGSFWFGSSDFYPETIDQSLRFNEGDTPYLSRTFVTPSSTRKIIIATWIKPSELGDETPIMYSSPSNTQNYFLMGFAADGFISATDNFNLFTVEGNTTRFAFRTERLFRDPTNWMHVCACIDTTQATSTDRVVIFFNGKRYTGGYSTYNTQPSQNRDFTVLNSAIEHRIGALSNANHAYGNLDGYLSEFYFIDGQSIFSDTSATINSTFLADSNTLATFCEQKNGVAVPKAYTGTFGNNGCRLTFEGTGTGTTSQGTTAQTNIGDDQSGQGHNFSVNGLASTDVVLDSPTNNFCVLNPLGKQSASALSEGGLKAIITSGTNSGRTPGTFAVNSGKWYWEVRQNSSNRFGMGVFDTDRYVMANEDIGSDAFEWGYITDGNKRNSGTIASYGGETANGHVAMVALDVDNEAIWFGKQGSWFNTDGSSDSATVKAQIEAGTTTNAVYTGVSGRLTPSFVRQTSNNDLTVNFGQDDTFAGNETAAGNTDGNGNGKFQYEPPSGFLALCSDNLPDVTIGPDSPTQADDHFNTFLYTGTNAANRNLALNTFTPDWVWLKSRSQADNHVVVDSSRESSGTYPNLHPNNTDAEASDSHPKIITNGIQVSQGLYDNNSVNFVVWNWKANGGTATASGSESGNTLAYSAQANPTAGFSIVTYTGNGANNADVTVNHGLGVTPRMVIVKNRTNANRWQVYHEDLSADSTYTKKNILLSSGNAESGYSSQIKSVSSSAFVVRDVDSNGNANVNKDSSNYVAYVFADIEGYSKFGKYIGNNSTDGPFAYTGFRPAFLMLKRSSSTGSWQLLDNKRNTFNSTDIYLFTPGNGSENDGSSLSPAINVDFLSNGFKIRSTEAVYNSSGGTFIYMAFATQPFKFSNAR